MGMFDHIHYNGRVFQTKDFDCTMHRFYIENGRLLESEGHTEDKSPATAWQKEHPGEELPAELQGILGMCGCWSWVETGKKDLNYHGVVNFYGDNPETKEWKDYDAKFTDGALVEVVRLPSDNVSHKLPPPTA